MRFPLDDLPEACVILDDREQVIGINRAAETLLKLKKDDCVGKSLAEACSGRFIFLSIDGSHPPESDEDPSLLSEGGSGLAEIKVSHLRDVDGNFLGQITVVRALEPSSPQSALRNQNEILLALQETTFDLHSSLELSVVFHNIVNRACKLLRTSHGYLNILRETEELEPVVGVGAMAEILKLKFAPGEGVAGTVWETGKSLLVSDYDQWPGRLPGFPRGLIRALLGMPLFLNGQMVGVIGVARGVESEASFSEEDILVLERFSDLAVLAFHNARLFEKAQAEITFRRKTERELRNANQVLQFQIERVEMLQAQLQEQAVRDSLTDLFNRRYLQEMLDVEIARATRSRTSLAVLMIDCDQLKHINDTYGHKTGDDALIHIANVIRERTRAGDIACRYGGDEFVVIFTNVSEETAFGRAENLRNGIAALPLPHKDKKINICVSIGVAVFPAHSAHGEQLLQKADQALYAAKHRGKNRVLLYSDRLD
jgi:diguanylate cyclase (GGDEF)-like protein